MKRLSKGMDLCFEFLSSVIVDLREGIITVGQVRELLTKVEDEDIGNAMTKILRVEYDVRY